MELLKKITRFFTKDTPAPIPAKMSKQERNVILLFAQGYAPLRDAAIKIHRLYLHDLDTPEQLFMREVDNACPDLVLRSRYREELLKSRKSGD